MPLHAGLVKEAQKYPRSSARAHVLGGRDDVLTNSFMVELVSDWGEFLSSDEDDRFGKEMSRHGSTGRSLGADTFWISWRKKQGESFIAGSRDLRYW